MTVAREHGQSISFRDQSGSKTSAVILDSELVLIDPRGAVHFYRLMAQMRTSHPDESQLILGLRSAAPGWG